MSLIRLHRSCHGKSAHAVYAFNKHKLEVYLQNNKPSRNEWGDFHLSCYLHPNSPSAENESVSNEFNSYIEFVEYRKMLYSTHGSDRRLITTA